MKTKTELLSNVSGDIIKTRVVDRNTAYVLFGDGNERWILHETVIVSKKDGRYTLNSGGWRTLTTKDRINKFSPARIYQENGIWYMRGGSAFYDGIVIDEQGNVVSEERKDPVVEVNKMKRRISKFISLITKDNLPVPSAGDCWNCSLYTEDGVPMGETSEDYSHLLNHVDEKYVHGSLLVNAMREYGHDDRQIGLHYSMKLYETFRRAVRKYLHKRLLEV